MENEEETPGEKKRLLLVEDKLENLYHGYLAGTQRGYGVDLACDLYDAMELLDTNRYDGVITDMCFHERGIKADQGNMDKLGSSFIGQLWGRNKEGILEGQFGVEIDELPTKVERVYLEALAKSNFQIKLEEDTEGNKRERYNYVGITDSEIKEELRDITLNAMSYEQAKPIDGTVMNVPIDESDFKKYLCRELRNIPALGYFVIQKSKEKGMPISALSSQTHADCAVPPLIASEIVSLDELYEQTGTESYRRYTGRLSDRFNEGNWNYLINELYSGRFYLSDNAPWEKVKENLHRVYVKLRQAGIITNKTIFSAGDKSIMNYLLSIDQLEGKIDETRPYVID